MSSKKKDEKAAEYERMKKIRAKRRFKAYVHMVMANLFWMQDVDEEALGEDVKKNVMLLLKKKKDQKSLLTYTDKLILSKPTELRTESEKNHLFKIIGNLKCFRKYPTNVKMQLAARCYFLYYGPNRVIVKQNREGHSLYFIMSGEVAVSITFFDPILSEFKTIVVGTMVAGQMFGEVSLLHNIPRTATITTISHCELIVLQKEDFDLVLKRSLQVVWDQILDGVARFSYFDGWDEVSMRECCIYSKIATYRMGDIIYGSGDHNDTYVHYVLKGSCRCVEELPVVEMVEGPYKSFMLFDRDTFNKDIRRRRKYRLPMIRTYTAYNVPVIGRNYEFQRRQSSMRGGRLIETVEEKPEENEDEEKTITTDDIKKLLGMATEEEKDEELPDCVKKIFMQVCVFNELAVFGLGENLKYRKIVAATDYVECLLIPKFWIWSKNKGNVWTGVVHTLNRKLPTTETVFKTFLADRSWGKHKREMINQLRGKPPPNSMNNIPYSIRLANDLEYGVGYH